MQGLATATLLDCRGLGKTPEEMDAPILAAIRDGKSDEVLGSLPVVRKLQCTNQVYQSVSEFLSYRCFGIPAVDSDVEQGGDSDASFWVVWLTTKSALPTYTDVSGFFVGYGQSCFGSVIGGYTYRKRWIDDSIEPFKVWTDPNGVREGVYWRERFLWFPSDGLMSNIRGIETGYCQNGDESVTSNNYERFGYISRVRFLDSGGSPVTLTKTSDQAFLIEYMFKFFSR